MQNREEVMVQEILNENVDITVQRDKQNSKP